MPEDYAVVDLGYGDAGKGTIVDYLASHRAACTVVKYTSGPQCAHNVLHYGTHHTFSQMGSGAFSGAVTFLGCNFLVNPLNLVNELKALRTKGAISSPLVDYDCRIITPFHRAANELRELARGDKAHGSCGQGVGEAQSDHLTNSEYDLTISDLIEKWHTPKDLARRLRDIACFKREQISEFWDAAPDLPWVELVKDWFLQSKIEAIAYALSDARLRLIAVSPKYVKQPEGQTVYEGGQGVLLDEWYGFHPYTTWSTTTTANISKTLDVRRQPKVLGVVRSYYTRHGNGPFVTEDSSLLSECPEPHNGTGRLQGAFRVGYFDMLGLKYALAVQNAVDKVDELAVTHMDRLAQRHAWPVCVGYEIDGEIWKSIPKSPVPDLEYQEQLTQKLLRAKPIYTEIASKDFTNFLEEQTGIPVTIQSWGPEVWQKWLPYAEEETPDFACSDNYRPVDCFI